MAKYIMRLDDACEKMDVEKWARMENLLDKYSIKPLVGIIPKCEDEQMQQYAFNPEFWLLAQAWISKDWTVAMHGYNHVYSTSSGGINPVNKRSEFAGESLEIQKEKIRSGIAILKKHDITPKVFFAPSHTFDENTLIALESESDIRIISDTVANDVYSERNFTFVPQQTGRARKLPFKTVTFCYHPNTMNDEHFERLEAFLNKHQKHFIEFPLKEGKRKKGIFDKALSWLYFMKRR